MRDDGTIRRVEDVPDEERERWTEISAEEAEALESVPEADRPAALTKLRSARAARVAARFQEAAVEEARAEQIRLADADALFAKTPNKIVMRSKQQSAQKVKSRAHRKAAQKSRAKSRR